MRSLPARNSSLQNLQETLCSYVDELGVGEAASLVGVSSDTIRRRVRGEQPWFFEEVLDLARQQVTHQHHAHIADALIVSLQGKLSHDYRPLRIPSELRDILRLVGRLTHDIAETLDDGRVDSREATNLLGLFAELDNLLAQVKLQLKELVSVEGSSKRYVK